MTDPPAVVTTSHRLMLFALVGVIACLGFYRLGERHAGDHCGDALRQPVPITTDIVKANNLCFADGRVWFARADGWCRIEDKPK